MGYRGRWRDEEVQRGEVWRTEQGESLFSVFSTLTNTASSETEEMG